MGDLGWLIASPLLPIRHRVIAERLEEVESMVRLNGKSARYHFQGVHGKVTQMRELVEVLDQMFDSFEKVNQLSKTMLGQPKDITRKIERLR